MGIIHHRTQHGSQLNNIRRLGNKANRAKRKAFAHIRWKRRSGKHDHRYVLQSVVLLYGLQALPSIGHGHIEV